MTLSIEGLRAFADNGNVKALLAVIAAKESGGAWDIINGGARFKDFSRHPYHGIPTTRGGLAAGGYQFLGTTWARLCERYEFPDFTPEYQTLGAIALIQGRGALDDIVNGRFEAAVVKLRPEWTSLPGASESRAEWTMDKARALYVEHGGRLDNGELLHAEPTPSTGRVPPQPADEPSKETTMPVPFLMLASALGPLIAEMIPAVAKAFDKKAETPQKVEAATKIVETIVKATNATNVQEAVEKMQSDPAIKKIASDAVLTNPQISGLLEIGGGVEAARKANADPAAPPFWRQGAFVVAVILTPLIYMTVFRVLWGDGYSEQLRTVVVTAILSGLLGALTGYFFGSMYSTISGNNARRATDEVKA